VAALSVMSFSMDHMTLIAIFTLISHNLIQESLVQANSGLNFFMAAGFRLFISFVVTFICGYIMGVTPAGVIPAVLSPAGINPAALSPDTVGTVGAAVQGLNTGIAPLGPMLADWVQGTGKLCIQIFCIIMPLMVVLELAKTFHLIEAVTRICSPLVSLMGLEKSSAMLWMTAAVFGLAYGSAVIVEETQTGSYERTALTKLHLSIGVNHAMIEDPALFLPLGIPVFWLWIPRLAAAMAVAWLYSGFTAARRLYAKRAGHKKLCDH